MNELLSLPNLHPAIVHLPLGALPLAVLFELAGLLRRRDAWLSHAATALFAVAALAALAALRTGEEAADGLAGVPAEAQPAIGVHSDWAHYTALALGILALLRLAIAYLERRGPRVALRGAAFVVSLAVLGLLLRTADLGGALVYKHALAVQQAVAEEAAAEPAPPLPAGEGDAASRLVRSADGSLHWRPGVEDAGALGSVLTVAEGFESEAVRAVASQGLELRISGRTLLVLPDTFGDVQVEATLERGSFEGSVGLVHHFRDAANAGLFTVATGGEARLLDRRDGKEQELDTGNVETGEVLELAVSSSGRHLKGLLAGATVTHGHVEAPPEGHCGLFFDGQGTLRVVSLAVTPLSGH